MRLSFAQSSSERQTFLVQDVADEALPAALGAGVVVARDADTLTIATAAHILMPGRHLQVLDEAGLIAIEKGYDRNRPQTLCRITANGRQRYLDYLKVLEQVVRDAAAGSGERSRAIAQRLAPA